MALSFCRYSKPVQTLLDKYWLSGLAVTSFLCGSDCSMLSQGWACCVPVQEGPLQLGAIRSSPESLVLEAGRITFPASQREGLRISSTFLKSCSEHRHKICPSRPGLVSVSVRTMATAQGGSAGGKLPLVEAERQPPQSSLPPADTLVSQKKAMRTVVKKELRQLSKEQRQAEDDAIQQHILDSQLFQRAGRLCAYLACEPLREVDTKRIIPAALSQGKALYVPRVEDRAAHMRMLLIEDPEVDTERNSMGIAEPTPLGLDGKPREDVMEADAPLDLILMPGLAFDRSGKRLGRGGGYYDVFLQKYLRLVELKGWRRPFLIAMSYKAQIQDTIPADETDQLVDGLMTAEGLLKFNSQL
jgi:5-formyltetrahydrofolate cyclo-ligase